MRTIVKNLTLAVDGVSREFRLTKFDAFSGVELLRLALKHRSGEGGRDLVSLLTDLTEEELRRVMTAAMNHTEVLLPAGYQRVMTGADWGWEDLEHDAPACLTLTLENVLWSLQGFFAGAVPTSRSGPPAA